MQKSLESEDIDGLKCSLFDKQVKYKNDEIHAIRTLAYSSFAINRRQDFFINLYKD